MSFGLLAFPGTSIYNLKSKLIDHNGITCNISDLNGKIQIFSMIYTRCKTICPIILSNMKAIEKLIDNQFLEEVNFSLISLDPDKDTIDVMHNFFVDKNLDQKRWNFYKSDKNETLKIALTTGIKYKKEKNDEYVHSNLIIILDKNGIIKMHHQGLDKNFDEVVKLIYSLK